MATARITIVSDQNQKQDDFISYRIIKNGIPITYSASSGTSIVQKTFKSYIDIGINGINKTGVNNNINTGFTANVGTAVGNGGTVWCIETMVITGSTKYVVAGDFDSWNGNTAYKNIVRLNQDGTIDTSFVPVTNFHDVIYTICIDSNNKIVCGGNSFQTSPNTLSLPIRIFLMGGPLP